MVELVHGPHCDADLRRRGCVCAETPAIEVQAAELAAMAAEWADLVAKREREETDRLARVAFA